MDKNPPAQCRGHEFDPRSRKIPHAAEQLSPCTTTTEAPILDPTFPTREATAMRSPHTTTRERLHAAVKTQYSQK